jgi:hypothetical protein
VHRRCVRLLVGMMAISLRHTMNGEGGGEPHWVSTDIGDGPLSSSSQTDGPHRLKIDRKMESGSGNNGEAYRVLRERRPIDETG